MTRTKLYLGNVNSEASVEDIEVFLKKYIKEEVSSIIRVDLDGPKDSHTYLVEFHNIEWGELQNIANRFHGMYWNGHVLHASLV